MTNIYWTLTICQALFWVPCVFSHILLTAILGGATTIIPFYRWRNSPPPAEIIGGKTKVHPCTAWFQSTEPILSATCPLSTREQPSYLTVQLSWTGISAPYCVFYMVGFWHLLLISLTIDWCKSYWEEQPHFWSGPIICSVRSCWETLRHPTLLLFILHRPQTVMFFFFWLITQSCDYSSFALVPSPGRELAEEGWPLQPAPCGSSMMAALCGVLGLVSNVSSRCCVQDSLYTQFCPSPAFVLRSAVPVISTLWWSESRWHLPHFPRKRNFLPQVWAEEAILYWNLWGIIINYSMSPHK